MQDNAVPSFFISALGADPKAFGTFAMVTGQGQVIKLPLTGFHPGDLAHFYILKVLVFLAAGYCA